MNKTLTTSKAKPFARCITFLFLLLAALSLTVMTSVSVFATSILKTKTQTIGQDRNSILTIPLDKSSVAGTSGPFAFKKVNAWVALCEKTKWKDF